MFLSGIVLALCINSLVYVGRAASFNNLTNHSINDAGVSDLLLSTPELIWKYGYPVEKHVVQTEDGYLLTHFRIPHGRSGATTRGGRPVILQHGILSASDIWILMGREKSLGFILADAGYDVWLTNIRGNRHSRKHVTLSPDNAKFWDFSWHEMGYFDIPATIDHIFATTGQKVYYIGHSMGTTILFVMTSTRPEYNEKLRLATALAPVAFLWNLRHRLLKPLIPVSRQIGYALEQTGTWELFPYSTKFANFVGHLCHDGAPTQLLCVLAYFLAYGDDSERVNKTLLPIYFSHLIAGTSAKSVEHYAQIVRSGKFREFDYGPTRNMVHYRQTEPPNYNLKNITAPVALYYGTGDLLVSPEGVRHLSDQLPHLVGMTRIPPPKFNHIDFILANDAKHLVFDRILNLMTVY
ncbi:Lipase 3 [Zootermopsis nevadensis]|uniref:Lipase n=1 Tax=Zootermopsis nevadensis TaxID=136037 RepID=A0A067QXT1_ZOONE|nr:Lipase 3 [Zootermopsis nevadensis]